LEDPFVAFVTLDGIDIREEFQVLHWQQLVSARNKIFPEAVPYGGHVAVGDIESCIPVSQNDASEAALGNASEATHASRRRRHRTPFPSLGDASFLVGLEDDVIYRESAYQLCGRNRRDLDSNSSANAATPPKALSVEEQRTSSH